MASRNLAAICAPHLPALPPPSDTHLALIQAQLLDAVRCLAGKRLIDFVHVDVIQSQAGLSNRTSAAAGCIMTVSWTMLQDI